MVKLRSLGTASRVWNAFGGLAKDTSWSLAHDAAHMVATFTSFLLLQRVLLTNEYGAYGGVYGIVGPIGAMAFAGVGLAALKQLIREKDDPNETLKSFLTLGIIMSGVGAVVAFLLSMILIEFGKVEIFFMIAAELVGVPIVFISAFLVQASSGLPASIRVKLGIVVLRFVVLVTLFLLDQLSVKNLAIGFTLTFSIYVAYILWFHLPKHGYRVSLGKPTRIAVTSTTAFSIPMGAGMLQTDGDKVALNAFGFGFDAGLYYAAYRIVLIGMLPLRALDLAAFQRFLPNEEGLKGQHLARAKKFISFSFPGSVAIAVAIYLSLPYLDFLFTYRYKEATEIVPWLLFFLPFIALSSTPINGLLGLGRANERAAIFCSAAFVSILMYIVLIPGRGWEGAATATILSEVYLAAVGWAALVYYQRKSDREIDLVVLSKTESGKLNVTESALDG